MPSVGEDQRGAGRELGRLMVAHYRLYCLDESMHIADRREFDARDDVEAIAAVRLDRPDTDREIWEAHRKVAIIRASNQSVVQG